MEAVGGALTGMISAGLTEISTTQLVVRCRVPPRVAIATSVFTLAIVAAVGAGIHALSAQPVWQVVGWSIPGVLIDSTIGSPSGNICPPRRWRKAWAWCSEAWGFWFWLSSSWPRQCGPAAWLGVQRIQLYCR